MQENTGLQLTTLTERFDLDSFIKGLVNDLDMLRAGKISVRDAQARAVLAKHVLRGVHYVVMAQRFLESRAVPVLPSPPTDAGVPR